MHDFNIYIHHISHFSVFAFNIYYMDFGIIFAGRDMTELEQLIQVQNSLLDKLRGECKTLTDKLDDTHRQYKYVEMVLHDILKLPCFNFNINIIIMNALYV